jgi:putative DNA primase/helicase
VIDALGAVSAVDAATETPTWLKVVGAAPATELVAVANGLLHLPSGRLLQPSPSFFNTTASTVVFDPDAPKPREWLRFLAQLWPDDQESIEALQDVFGYLLSPDLSQQKIPLLVGPPRCGKGTIAHILSAMIGQRNTVAPTLASLETNFGLEPLIGKSVAIIGDARISAKADQLAIAERLLTVSGEDSITIDRKYMSTWTGRLPVRFLILSNELPGLIDASGAMASRFLLLRIKVSFLGKEDRALKGRLLRELPGILNWARAGYLRLNARGYFVPPTSAADAVEELEALGSPVKAFVTEKCTIGTGRRVLIDSMYGAWRSWCIDNGRREPGTKQTFSRNLHSAFSWVRTTRPREGVDRNRYFEGLDLGEDGRFDDL